MFINEVIERADALCENEYGLEEKYHWCDVVGAEIDKRLANRYRRVTLKAWTDGRYLLPEDCEFDFIKKIALGRQSIKKENMLTHGWRTDPAGNGRLCLVAPGFMLERLRKNNTLDVVYLPAYHPIRRISLTGAAVEIPQKDTNGKRTTLKMDETCPFIPGDTITVKIGKITRTLHITGRKAELAELTDISETEARMFYTLEYGEGEADDFPSGQCAADMERIVTNTTQCPAPYDEMYIDYICAQICFYQRNIDMYRQFMSRCSDRMEEYVKLMKAFDVEKADTAFVGWWNL